MGIDTSNLMPDYSGLSTTVVNNYYNQSPASDGVPQVTGEEVLGQAFNMDLEKFITNYSIMSK